MSGPISRLQLAEQEIDRTFGHGYAAAHPELVAVVMQSAASDYATQLVARAIEHVSQALLVEEEEASGIMQPPVIEHAPRAPGRPPLTCDRGRGSPSRDLP